MSTSLYVAFYRGDLATVPGATRLHTGGIGQLSISGPGALHPGVLELAHSAEAVEFTPNAAGDLVNAAFVVRFNEHHIAQPILGFAAFESENAYAAPVFAGPLPQGVQMNTEAIEGKHVISVRSGALVIPAAALA